MVGGLERFDAIIIGAGMGGGTAARALAEAGHRVLVLEAGIAGERGDESAMTYEGDPGVRLNAGCWPDPVFAEIDGRKMAQHAPLGCGIGGTSLFYAATLERPWRQDIEPLEDLAHPTGGWPVTWEELAPFFDEAERWYQVCGEPDPLDPRPEPELRAPPPLSASDRMMMAHLRNNGMHPYRLHSACAVLPGCQSCFGRKCPRPCKMDGRSAGIEPALATGNLRVETGAWVQKLIAGPDRVSAVEYQREGETRRVTAPHILLAAGAYSSPGILRSSVSEDWPEGIGNRHDQVGRRLMFHYSQRFVVWPGAIGTAEVTKTLAFRDFYQSEGQRLGMVQSMGIRVSFGEILHFLRMRALERGYSSRLLRHALRIPAGVIKAALGHAVLFDGQMEDFPRPENRLIFSPEEPRRITFSYSVPEEAHQRRALFRRRIRAAFRGMRPMFLSDLAEPNLGHACGTLPMGRDPAHSVTDGTGRVHGVKNLWVTDASVFPTSMAVNPSLTVAALAIRQARVISAELKRDPAPAGQG